MKAARPLSWLRALRPNQWTKNLIVLAAFVFAFGDRQQHEDCLRFFDALQAALAFCLLSSGVYLLNDIRDLALDRVHPTKRFRPLAAGELSTTASLILSGALLLAGLAWSALIARPLLLIAGAYVLLQFAYTLGLKRIALLDVFIIAVGFVLRALAGGAAAQVRVSPWLLLCTLLLALFLALCKRRHEKVTYGTAEEADTLTRHSLAQYDEHMLDRLVTLAGVATLICYMLYTIAPETIQKFGTSHLVFTVPFVVMGLLRYRHLVYRRERGDRPEQLLLSDWPLLLDIALYGATVLTLLLHARHA